jgi:hypothetical protein
MVAFTVVALAVVMAWPRSDAGSEFVGSWRVNDPTIKALVDITIRRQGGRFMLALPVMVQEGAVEMMFEDGRLVPVDPGSWIVEISQDGGRTVLVTRNPETGAAALRLVMEPAGHTGGVNSPKGTDGASDSPSASSVPVAQFQTAARNFRAGASPSQAWWVRVSEAEAHRLLGEAQGASADSAVMTYVVILGGDFTGARGEPYDWAILHFYNGGQSSGSSVFMTNDRPDSGEQQWMPLSLSSE